MYIYRDRGSGGDRERGCVEKERGGGEEAGRQAGRHAAYTDTQAGTEAGRQAGRQDIEQILYNR